MSVRVVIDEVILRFVTVRAGFSFVSRGFVSSARRRQGPTRMARNHMTRKRINLAQTDTNPETTPSITTRTKTNRHGTSEDDFGQNRNDTGRIHGWCPTAGVGLNTPPLTENQQSAALRGSIRWFWKGFQGSCGGSNSPGGRSNTEATNEPPTLRAGHPPGPDSHDPTTRPPAPAPPAPRPMLAAPVPCRTPKN